MKIKKKFHFSVWSLLKYIYLFFNIIVMLFPLAFMFMNAFKTNSEITVTPFAFPTTLQTFAANATMVLSGVVGKVKLTPFFTMLKNTVILTVVPLVIMLICATLCAYALGRLKFRWKPYAVIIILLAQTVPYFGYMYPLYFELNFFNLLNSLGGVSLVYVAVSLSSTIILMMGFYQSFPVAVEEAAMIDGCNERQKFILIVMPMSVSIIGSMAIVNFMGYWNEFAIASLMLTSPELRTINLGVFATKSQMGGVGKKDYIMTLLTLSAIPNLIFFTLFQKSIINGISLGSVKG